MNVHLQDSAKNPMVLVVDDTPEILSLIHTLLRDTYQVKSANNGRKGLQIAQSEPQPDLILLDIMMPDLDGYEVCIQLKEDPKTRDIPVIFLTAKSEIENEERGFSLGAVDYVTKPSAQAYCWHVSKRKLRPMPSAEVWRVCLRT